MKNKVEIITMEDISKRVEDRRKKREEEKERKAREILAKHGKARVQPLKRTWNS